MPLKFVAIKILTVSTTADVITNTLAEADSSRVSRTEKLGNIIEGKLGFFGDGEKGSVIGPHQRLQRWVIGGIEVGSTAIPTVGIWK